MSKLKNKKNKNAKNKCVTCEYYNAKKKTCSKELNCSEMNFTKCKEYLPDSRLILY